jgi:hypothetical protein
MSLQVRTGFVPLTMSLLFAGAIASCGGGSGGGGGSGAAMYIDTCSLGCSSGASASQVTCSIAQHSRNGDITVYFSEPVLASTVSPSSFQLIDVASGQSPIGVRFVDSTDPSGKKMIFRPAIFFDANGNTIFGLNPGTTYRVTIPGTLHGDAGPFVSSTTGAQNQSRMQCDFMTTNQIEDLVAGPPRSTVLVQPAVSGDPSQGGPLQTADGLVNVWRNSAIVMRFNDVMNPATLLNPTTHQLTQITIVVDTDGDLHTTADRVPLYGQVALNIDLIALRTDLTFTPANGMPSGTSLSGQARHIIVTIPNTVTDLVGNGCANPGDHIFQAEIVPEPATTLPSANGEGFTDATNEHVGESGADWGNGRLTRGFGGGSGRLGELRIPTLQALTLDCDGTEFRNTSVPDSSSNYIVVKTSGTLDNAHPSAKPSAPNEYATNPASWPTVVVTDGVFEFSSLNLDAGATLLIHGTTHPARLFSRGPVSILGTIDIRGTTPPDHDSEMANGDPGGSGGPGGGHGGAGGDRWDNTNSPDILACTPPGIPNPGAILAGRNGVGLGGSGTRGVGLGGAANPFPGPNQICMSNDPAFLLGIIFSDPGNLPDGSPGFCTVRQVSSPGGGGAYATSGTAAVPLSSIPFGLDPMTNDPVSNLPAVAAQGGNSATLGIEPPDPESGHRVRKLAGANLRGGTGGGGGGSQLFDTSEDNNPFPFGYCYDTDDLCSNFVFLSHYRDQSAGGGGGGGGALQLVSGEQLHLGGSIKANGGDGGSSMYSTVIIPGVFDGTRKSRASPGGAGSGGAVRLQGQIVDVAARDPNDPHDAPRIDVTGGVGGTWSASYPLVPPIETVSVLGTGGRGGQGLMRLEDMSGGSNPPTTLMTRCSEAPKLAPYDATNDPCGILSLSVGPWDLSINRPETFSGASSCWMRAPGNYFELDFVVDDLTHNPPVYGWNMDVVYHDPASGQDVLTTYRGRDANTPFATGDFESNLGTVVNYLNTANPPGNQFGTGVFDPSRFGTYMAVRFQGAVANLAQAGQTPCDLVLVGGGAQIQPGSLTPWVSHPAELNEFLPRPNIVRFCVVFDRSLALAAGVNAQINGVTNLKIQVQPN